MRFFDYLEKISNKFIVDDNGDYLIGGNLKDARLLEGYTDPCDFYAISREKYSEIEVRITDKKFLFEIMNTDDKAVNDISNLFFRYDPFCRMRGAPVTREQAFDIIRRTDRFFHRIEPIYYHKEYIKGDLFYNDVISLTDSCGWIHADGTVGLDDIPIILRDALEIKDFVLEWARNLVEFPYLDLIITVGKWSDILPNVRPLDSDEDDFYDAVEMGIYVHDKKIEILNKADTIAKYKEYDKLYGSHREKFDRNYYMKNDIVQVDLPYLKRCIEAYGLDAEEELDKIGKRWKLFLKCSI